MDGSARQNLAGTVYAVGLLALAVGLGWLARSLMVGALVAGAMIALHVAAGMVQANPNLTAVFVAWLGAWGISYAGMTARFAGRWLWSIPWVLAALIYTTIAISARGRSQLVSTAGGALAAGSAIAAVAHPLWLYGMTREEAQEYLLGVIREWWWVLAIAAGVAFVLPLLVAAFQVLRSRRRRARIRKLPGMATPPRRPPSHGPPTPRPAPVQQPPRQPPIQQAPRPAPTQPAPRPAPSAPIAGGPRSPVAKPPAGGTPGQGTPGGGQPVHKPPVRKPPAHETPVRKPAAHETPVRKPPARKPPVPAQRDEAGRTILVSGDPQVQPTIRADEQPQPTIRAEGRDGPPVLYRCQAPIVDLARTGADHVLLRADGQLLRWHAGGLTAVPGVQLDGPIGVHARGESVVATSRSRIVVLDASEGTAGQLREYPVARGIACAALNPFGTILAFAPPDRAEVSALLLVADEMQPIVGGIDGPSALAFSDDGRELAVATDAGTVLLVDMSTRAVERRLPPLPGRPDQIVAVAPDPTGGWIGVHAGGAIAHWDAAGVLVDSGQEPTVPTTIDVGRQTHQLAVGCLGGRVRVLPIPLGAVVLDQDVTNQPIVRVAFEDDEHALIVAARDGVVRRVSR